MLKKKILKEKDNSKRKDLRKKVPKLCGSCYYKVTLTPSSNVLQFFHLCNVLSMPLSQKTNQPKEDLVDVPKTPQSL